MRTLITGGAGFIGSRLCEKYTQEGHMVLCEVSLPLYPKMSEEDLWGAISAVREILRS